MNSKGSAVVFILLAVALFAAMIMFFTRSSNQGTGNLDTQKANIIANDVISYSHELQRTIDKLRQKGCSESELSFENTEISGFTNSNSPSDKSCHIFDAAGGAFPLPSAKGLSYAWNVMNRFCIPDVGTNGSNGCGGANTGSSSKDLPIIFKLGELDDKNAYAVCQSIANTLKLSMNKNVGVEDWLASGAKFTGAFTSGGGMYPDGYTGKEAACFRGDDTYPGYYYYKILIIR
jgi:hypothetical protein